MVEGCDDDNSYRGRTPANQMVHFTSPEQSFAPGELAEVNIGHAGKHSLKGIIYEKSQNHRQSRWLEKL